MHHEIVGNCIEGDGLEQFDGARSTGNDVVEDKKVASLEENVSLTSLNSNNEEVVLAFDFLQCHTVEVVNGVSKPVEVFRVEDCLVPDEGVDDEGLK
ncbi:hypothetical protein L6452_17836 [Arctium lappa]|uniref:Uncharacterized protein n=1 Tax=Arctium lappa TaxID=4217 RepID=A0ACB9C4G9_ARCLA|nr:hypothetical protein L6452_17836 [Arctium lappa]